jgi:purine-cytosine permease-like protein
MSQSPNRLLGLFLGIVYLIDGIYGFFLTSNTAFFASSGPQIIHLFSTNPFHNVVHIVVGVVLLVAALVGPRFSKGVNTTLGALFLLIGILGWIVVISPSSLNVLAINGPDNIQNFVTAVLLLVVGIGADPVAREGKAA